MNNLSKQKGICLIGANGFLGSAIAKEIEREGLKWIGFTKSQSSHSNIKQIKSFHDPIFQKSLLNFPYIINAMGSMKPIDFEENTVEVLDIFWKNIENLQAGLQNSKIEKFLQISSAGTIYGECIKNPHREIDNTNPISWYGRAKLLEEIYYQNFAKRNKIDFLCTRVTNPYGNINKTDHGFIDVLINSIIYKKRFKTFKDDNHSRDFIYAPDMAYSIVNFLLSEHTGTLNVASGNTIKLSKIINYIQSIDRNFQPDMNLVSSDFDVNNNEVDISRLKSLSLDRETNNVFNYINSHLKKL